MKLPKISVDYQKSREIVIEYEKKKAVNELIAMACLFALGAYLLSGGAKR